MMVDTQIRPSDVTKFPIIDAFLSVRREAFVPDALIGVAYADASVPLAPSRAMLEPRTFAKMLDALDIQPTEMVLDLGCGLGYSADVITVQGAVEVMPQAILDQLKDGGRIAAIFIQGALGEVRIGHKSGSKVTWRMAFNAGATVLPGYARAAQFAL